MFSLYFILISVRKLSIRKIHSCDGSLNPLNSPPSLSNPPPWLLKIQHPWMGKFFASLSLQYIKWYIWLLHRHHLSITFCLHDYFTVFTILISENGVIACCRWNLKKNWKLVLSNARRGLSFLQNLNLPWKIEPPPPPPPPPRKPKGPLNSANFEPPFIFQTQHGQPTHHLGGGGGGGWNSIKRQIGIP